jgi:toxin FitB
MYLLDTGIVLELRKAKSGRTDPGFARWAAGMSRQNLFISAISLLELQNAAAQLERKDRPSGLALRAWIAGQVIGAFEGRILPVDAAVAKRLGNLPYSNARDGLLAATALEHGLTLVTQDKRAFKAGRVKILNPWGYTPEAGEEDADWRQAARAAPLWLKNLFVRT